MGYRLDTKLRCDVTVRSPIDQRPMLGELEYSPGELIKLTLRQVQDGPTLPRDMGRTLIGDADRGHRLTLLDCLPARWTTGTGHSCKIEVYAHRAIFGHHVSDVAKATFSGATINLTGLEEWYGTNEIQHSVSPSLSLPVGHLFRIECEHSMRFGFSSLADACTVRSDHHIGVKMEGYSYGSITSERGIRISFREPFSLEGFDQILSSAQSFVSLLCGQQMFLARVGLRPLPSSGDGQDTDTAWLLGTYPQADDPTLLRGDTFLPLEEIRDTLPGMWIEWLSRYQQFQAPIQQFTATQLFNQHLPAFEYLTAIGALESLHRSQGRRKLDLAVRIQALLAALPSDVRSVFTDDIAHFVRTMVDTRNYYTHFDPAKKTRALDGVPLVGASDLLRWLFRTSLLAALGAPYSLLRERLLGSRSVQEAKMMYGGR